MNSSSIVRYDRKTGKLKNIEPDSKSQITIEYKDGKPADVKSVVISTQHSADVSQSQVRELVKPYIERSIPKNLFRFSKRYLIKTN